ncbi:MAG TPA: hypothetical protein VFQ39_01845 [Longimicrobium sp.]|nr:hypothetical protein [Longimicrobium sp.]
MSKFRLDLNNLAVDTFEAGTSYAVSAKPSIRYTDCGSCGIACTAIDCPVPSANYSDCGSCGIACTAIDCA